MGTQAIVNDNNDFEQELQAYMEHMEEELSAAEQLIQDMQNMDNEKNAAISIMNGNSSHVAIGRAAFEFWEAQHLITEALRVLDPNCTGAARAEGITNWANAMVYNTTNFIKKCGSVCKTYCGALEELQEAGQKIKADEDQLAKIDPNINGTVINQLNELLAHSVGLSFLGLRDDDFNRALQQQTKIFNQLCDVLMDTIRVDLAQAGMEKFADSTDPGAEAAIMQFAGIAIQAEFQEQFSLQNIQTDVINDNTGWNNEESTAEADEKTSHWYDFITGGGPDMAKDESQIFAAEIMIGILKEVQDTISPLISVVDPGMQEFKIILDELKKKVQSIIANGGSIQELKDAMVEALSILTAIIAETQKVSSQYDKEMNQGSMAASQMQMNDSLAQEEVIEDAKKYAAVMGKLLKAVQYIGMAVVFLLNPGAGMALMMALEMLLTATGVMDKLQNALENSKLGSVGGDVMMCGIEMAATAGGAAAIDMAIGQAAKASVKAAVETTEKVVEEVVEQAVKAAAKAASKVGDTAVLAARASGATVTEALEAGEQAAARSIAAAKTVAKETVEKAVETAQKKVALVYMNKTIPELMSSIFKGEMRIAMETAMKEAAQTAGKSQELEMLVETAAKQGSSEVIGETEITSIATKAADQAVAKAANLTEESVSKLDKMTLLGERTAGKKAAARAAFSGIAAMGSVGLPADFAAMAQHKDKKDLSEGWEIAMQVIQALMQIIGMLGQTDAGLQTLSSPGVLNKFFTGTQVAQGGLEAIGSAGVADADFEQAGAVKALAKDQSVMDMMQFIMEQLKKNGQLQRDQYSKEMQQTSKTTLNLAMHFNDANQDVAEALAVLSV